MPVESVIAHRGGEKVAVLREDYLTICDQNACAAMVLSQFEYWHNVRAAHREQAASQNRAGGLGNLPPTQNTDLWVYKTRKELHQELFAVYSLGTIGVAVDLLVAKGYLHTRHNPAHPWDRTLQYRLQVATIQDAINALGGTYTPVLAMTTTEARVPVFEERVERRRGLDTPLQQLVNRTVGTEGVPKWAKEAKAAKALLTAYPDRLDDLVSGWQRWAGERDARFGHSLVSFQEVAGRYLDSEPGPLDRVRQALGR
jgi:hypothetical protein